METPSSSLSALVHLTSDEQRVGRREEQDSPEGLSSRRSLSVRTRGDQVLLAVSGTSTYDFKLFICHCLIPVENWAVKIL